MKRSLTEWLTRTGSIVSVLVCWELVSRSGLVSQRLMPSLLKVATAFYAAIENGDLFYHGTFSLERALVGFFLAIIIGVPLGAAMARVPLFEAVFEPLFSISYPVPKIALYPIFIFIFGLGSGSKIALVLLECAYPITVNTYFGIRRVQISWLRAAESMGTSRIGLFWKVALPAAAADIFSGIRIALPVAFIIVVLAEMIGESVGFGYYISFQSASFDYATSLAGVLAVAIMGFSLDRLLVELRTHLIFWERFDRADR
jgi:NitT/TauT family transport system permease protein